MKNMKIMLILFLLRCCIPLLVAVCLNILANLFMSSCEE